MRDVFYSELPADMSDYCSAIIELPNGYWHCLVDDTESIPAGWVKYSELPADGKRPGGNPFHTYLGRETILVDQDGGFDEL